MSSMQTHLRWLEAEAIHVLREGASKGKRPVMLYSIGKDSSVLLHLALKAFYPARLPFPLLHIDTTWKFREMIEFRDETIARLGVRLITHTNIKGIEDGVSPITSDPDTYTFIMKTQPLREALDLHGFDTAFGGSRRDEEKSRAKERIFSVRTKQHSWDPKAQRPEMWRIYNTRISGDETLRVFPLSNWTELDIWEYIKLENIPVVPLYFSKERPVIHRNGALIVCDDDRMPLAPGEEVEDLSVRFRALGCYPLTGGVRSEAETLDQIIAEMRESRLSERQGRIIDHGDAASMEKKKREGYF